MISHTISLAMLGLNYIHHIELNMQNTERIRGLSLKAWTSKLTDMKSHIHQGERYSIYMQPNDMLADVRDIYWAKIKTFIGRQKECVMGVMQSFAFFRTGSNSNKDSFSEKWNKLKIDSYVIIRWNPKLDTTWSTFEVAKRLSKLRRVERQCYWIWQIKREQVLRETW